MNLPLNLSLLLRNAALLARPHADPRDHELHELLWTNHFGLLRVKALSRLTWRDRWADEATATNAALF